MIKFSYCILGAIVLCIVITVHGKEDIIDQNGDKEVQQYMSEPEDEKVEIKVYYESLCHDSRIFDTMQLTPVIEKLFPYVDIQMFPYGNAETIESDGKYDFRCQHGPTECYGNKLHACALNLIGNKTKALLFNSCLMDFSQPNRGSNDIASDKCGQTLEVDTDQIKDCAKGPEGTTLLKYYGHESKRAQFKWVPYVLVNGRRIDPHLHILRDVCAAFTRQPPPCVEQD